MTLEISLVVTRTSWSFTFKHWSATCFLSASVPWVALKYPSFQRSKWLIEYLYLEINSFGLPPTKSLSNPSEKLLKVKVKSNSDGACTICLGLNKRSFLFEFCRQGVVYFSRDRYHGVISLYLEGQLGCRSRHLWAFLVHVFVHLCIQSFLQIIWVSICW